MRLVSIEPRPGTGFVEPVLLLDISIGYPMGQKVPLDLLVTVRAEGKIIGTARPSAIELGTTTLETPATRRGKDAQEQTQYRQTALPLSARILDFLEDLRTRNSKRDIVLQCDVEVRALVSRTVNAHVARGRRS